MAEIIFMPMQGAIYWYLTADDEERIATWGKDKKADQDRWYECNVFNMRRQAIAAREGKLCDSCGGYGEVTVYAHTPEGHIYTDGYEPCHCTKD